MILAYSEIVDAVIKSIQTDATKKIQKRNEILTEGVTRIRDGLCENRSNMLLRSQLTSILQDVGV